MPDSSLTLALREAYAAAPSNVIIFHTLEMWHPNFSEPIRVVRDYVDLTATLESTAPRNPSSSVNFVAFNFNFTRPEVSATGVPQVTIEIDNVDRSIVSNIELAVGSSEVVQVIYREFISTDLSAPQNNPPLTMSLLSIAVDVFKVTATAGFPNLMNKRFPSKEYSAEAFPGLI